MAGFFQRTSLRTFPIPSETNCNAYQCKLRSILSAHIGSQIDWSAWPLSIWKFQSFEIRTKFLRTNNTPADHYHWPAILEFDDFALIKSLYRWSIVPVFWYFKRSLITNGDLPSPSIAEKSSFSKANHLESDVNKSFIMITIWSSFLWNTLFVIVVKSHCEASLVKNQIEESNWRASEL